MSNSRRRYKTNPAHSFVKANLHWQNYKNLEEEGVCKSNVKMNSQLFRVRGGIGIRCCHGFPHVTLTSDIYVYRTHPPCHRYTLVGYIFGPELSSAVLQREKKYNNLIYRLTTLWERDILVSIIFLYIS